jgi:N-acyl homoserine lactone hydrolase
MRRLPLFVAAISAWLACPQAGLAQPAAPQHGTSGVERLYVLYCGDIALNDASSFTPGASGPGALSDTCYLVRHGQDWLLWDTGLPDSLVDRPDGMKSNAGVWTSKKTLASQLAGIGLKPSDIRYLALSHSHPDHVGNLNLFPQATLVVQKAEYDWVQPFGGPRFKPEQPAIKAEGDRDLFGDGTVLLISTPGHSPGHQCLLVKLPKTGAVLLSGDAAHFKDNWDNRRVPAMNFNKDQTAASMQKIADVMAKEHAQLWINHDKAQRDGQKMSPEFYD